jgi:hemerythrin superfamily protein
MKKFRNTITSLMLEQHYDWEKLLYEFEKSLSGDYKLMLSIFYEFKREIEKHISIEEKVIFRNLNPLEEENYFAVIPELIRQHNVVLEILNETKEDLIEKENQGIVIDISKFKKLLLDHKNYEEKQFYPDLEKYLTKSQKKSIIKEIEKINR